MGKNSSPKNLLLSFKVWFFKTFQTAKEKISATAFNLLQSHMSKRQSQLLAEKLKIPPRLIYVIFLVHSEKKDHKFQLTK